MHGHLRGGIASVRRWAVAAGVLVVAGATVAGMPGVRAAATHSVELTIISGKNRTPGGSMDLNGYQRGAMTITIPVGWKVVVNYENIDPPLLHSLAVLPSGAHNQVSPDAPPAFPGATTTNLGAGLPKGTKQTFTFEATKAGTYELVCGVQGHAVAGMWNTLVVSATAEAPSVTPAGATPFTVK